MESSSGAAKDFQTESVVTARRAGAVDVGLAPTRQL
jgi:hypothetical protein